MTLKTIIDRFTGCSGDWSSDSFGWWANLSHLPARYTTHSAPRTRHIGVANPREIFNLAVVRALMRLRRDALHVLFYDGF